eukprot:CAMPEP_0119561398 /NCGR_PEP_ID=MMETSP1352-20130426/17466_1 /TAXON_ID=265584 /ORGANISM="Stauroneis constricta, Strain CCMP1120" /LENGTH=802 /DNA_ID=CAMNT_0007609589 /DNA_START=367 /DNA_END=2775 /DNA_ORIENTATION=-
MTQEQNKSRGRSRPSNAAASNNNNNNNNSSPSNNRQRSRSRSNDRLNNKSNNNTKNNNSKQRKSEITRKKARELEQKFGTSNGSNSVIEEDTIEPLSSNPKHANAKQRRSKIVAKQKKRAIESKFAGKQSLEESIYITDFPNYQSESDDSFSISELKQQQQKKKKSKSITKQQQQKKKNANNSPTTTNNATNDKRASMQRKRSGDLTKVLSKAKNGRGGNGFDPHQSYSSKLSADTYPSTTSGSRKKGENGGRRLSPKPPTVVNKKIRKPPRSLDQSLASLGGAPSRGRRGGRSVASAGVPGTRPMRSKSMDRSVASMGNSFSAGDGGGGGRARSKSRPRNEEMSQFGGPLRRGRSRDRSMDRSVSSFGHPDQHHQRTGRSNSQGRRKFQRSRSLDGSMMASRSDFNMSGTNFYNPDAGPGMMRQKSKFHNSGRQMQTSRSFHGRPSSFHDSAFASRSFHDGPRRSFDGGRSVASAPSRRDMFQQSGTMGRSTMSGFGGPMGKSTMSGFGGPMEQSRRPGSVHGPPMSQSGMPPPRRRMRYLRYRREDIKTPPKSLVIIWVVVSLELVLDLVTTIISFIALVEDSDCCGSTIDLGPWPRAVTIPFFVLIVIELCFLARAIKLTLCPDLHRPPSRNSVNWFCRCMRWNAKTVFKIINFMVLINPFFGSVVAWILLYQSSKTECFTVLGLEAASLLLHFISIWLEGDEQTICSLIFHCIPVVPFFVSVVIILIYLNQGGVCYLVEEALFWYSGCQLCPNGSPPTPDGMCQIGNTTNATFVEATRDMLVFGQYCSETENFCFFEY